MSLRTVRKIVTWLKDNVLTSIAYILLLFYIISYGEFLGIKIPYYIPHNTKYQRQAEYEKRIPFWYTTKIKEIKEKEEQTCQILELRTHITEEETEEIIEEIVAEVQSPFNLTDEEKDLLARLIKLEAGDQSWECQCAVGSVVLNRLKQQFGGNSTLHTIVYARGQFSTSRRLKRTKPTQTQRDVVEYLLTNGSTLPEDVVYFHYKRYGKWGKPYCHIGTEYFSRA